MQNDVTIVVPAHNEEAGIGQVLADVKAAMADTPHSFEIVVVDDSSTDRTAEIARESGVTLYQHSFRRGYGEALKTGIRIARSNVIVTIDGDGTYPCDVIPTLLARLDGIAMVVGARIGANVNIPFLRRLPKLLLLRLANYLADAKIPDLNSGLRVFHREDALRLFRLLPSGFSFSTTITLAMMQSGAGVEYVPIDYHKRFGKSKIHPILDTKRLLFQIVRMIIYVNPLKVFFPISIVLFVVGAVKLVFDIVQNQNVAELSVLLIMGAIQVLAIGLLADLVNRRAADDVAVHRP
jgi:glycosyltransferase involved in cell wall biosynthesis